jgi:hypothetical protein
LSYNLNFKRAMESYGKHSYDEDKHNTEGKNSTDKGKHSIDE